VPNWCVREGIGPKITEKTKLPKDVKKTCTMGGGGRRKNKTEKKWLYEVSSGETGGTKTGWKMKKKNKFAPIDRPNKTKKEERRKRDFGAKSILRMPTYTHQRKSEP